MPGPASAFDLDPEITRETTWSGPAAMLTARRGGVVRVRADQGPGRSRRTGCSRRAAGLVLAAAVTGFPPYAGNW